MNELKISPVGYVYSLDSPIGVYLRREILKKESKADATLKKEIYQKVVAEQSADGSWDQLFVKTANELWNLALVGYNAQDPRVQRGLDWLSSIQKHSNAAIQASSAQLTGKTQALCDRHSTVNSDQAAPSFTRQPTQYT